MSSQGIKMTVFMSVCPVGAECDKKFRVGLRKIGVINVAILITIEAGTRNLSYGVCSARTR